MLRAGGKDIGSTPEDHLNCVDPAVLANDSIVALLGSIRDVPVSLYVGEKLGPSKFGQSTLGLYTAITLRKPNLVLPKLGIDVNEANAKGFTGIPTFAHIQAFAT